MAFTEWIITIIFVLVGVLIFLFGFLLVYRNLKKVNIIEGEKFNSSDWLAMVGFGLLFAVSIVFMLNITLKIISSNIPTPEISGIALTIMLSILVIYPLWEIIFLGRPTSDAVHDFHKFLESEILEKFKGKMAYLISFVIFLVIYILPIIILQQILDTNWIQVSFMWFLIFPLFFLQYFAANGTVSGIISRTYKNRVPDHIRENLSEAKKFKNKILNLMFLLIVWIPFLLNLYNILRPIYNVYIADIPLISQKSPLMGYISLFISVPFGIKGFFSKFWNRKSKTKTIDFLFAGYIFIAIGVNMMISFYKINDQVIYNILDENQILNQLTPLFEKPELLIPIIIIQSVITFVYGLVVLLRPNTDFHADIKLEATAKAFGKINIYKLIEKRNEQKEKAKEDADLDEIDLYTKKKFDYPTLFKSLLLTPRYSSYGVDLNEQIRFKASQYLLLIAIEDRTESEKISNFIFKAVIEPYNQEENQDLQQIYISKEAIDLLGEIGEVYPDLIIERMIDSLSYGNIHLQEYILDALGDIGEYKKNMKIILKQIQNLFAHERYEVRQAAFSAVAEMILEGNSEDKDFVGLVLNRIYSELDNYENAPVIDSSLEALVKMCVRIADDIDFDKIKPFIQYNKAEDPDINDFIQQNALTIMSYIVYYNLEKFSGIIPFLVEKLDDTRSFIRYVASDALGNYILKCSDDGKHELVLKLLNRALHDPNPDVAYMCTESITEFLILNPGYKIKLESGELSILDYFINALKSKDRLTSENASEALKLISPLYEEDISPILENMMEQSESEEIIRDCLHIIAVSGKEEHESIHLDKIYKYCTHQDPLIRSEAVHTLGSIAENRQDIDESFISDRLEDQDPQVRLQAIFALGKLGMEQPEKISQILIQKFYELDREADENVSEIELFAESLGLIGSVYPSNEIIISLQSALMGDTNPFAKDVIAKALGKIGYGMIKSGNAVRRIKNKQFYNQISWLRTSEKKEYTIGNIIIIFLEALQLKGIPEPVNNEISDSIQDLLPVFLFIKREDQREENEILNTIKELLAQAYYSNYNSEILETMDRIDSLISFKEYLTMDDDLLQKQLLFYSKQYTPDGKQFFDQGKLFLILEDQDEQYLRYALQSFEIATDLSPYEFYTPEAIFQMGINLKKMKRWQEAKKKFQSALEIYTSLDEIEKMKECEDYIQALTTKD